jgi:hypothetical protein
MLYENDDRRNWQTTTLLVFGILILIRLALSSRLPSYFLPDMPHDDGWILNRAVYISKGKWFGPYDQFTLIKGVFSPLLLAFSAYIGVTFNGLNTALYCFACVVFVAAIRPIIKNRWLQVLCFAVLLFNPISYALETGQRIYRVGMGQWQILLIFGCLIAVFLRRNQHCLKWSLVCGLTLGAFLQTREDGTWIYPFVLGGIVSTILVFLLEKGGPRRRIVVFLLPVVIALFLNGATAIANYICYGAPVVNDRDGGNFAKVAGDLYLITPNADDDRLYKSSAYKDHYYNIYASTMEKAFAASPTLNGAAQHIRDAIHAWGAGEEPQTGQLSTDHMLFALRDGVKAAGHYKSLCETEAFYGKVHKELQAAFRNGTLAKRGFPISPLIEPLQKGDIRKTLSLMPMAIKEIVDFRDVSSRAVPSEGSESDIEKASLMAGGEYIPSQGQGWLVGSGWAFAKDDDTHLTAGLYDQRGALIGVLPFYVGEDVFKYMLSKGFKYQNAKMSRFSFKVEGYNLKSGLTLRFFGKDGAPFREIPLNGSATCGEDGAFGYCIDGLESESSKMVYTRFIDRANRVIAVYQKLDPIFGILACMCYVAATILLIGEILKKQAMKTLPVWLFMTGIALTFLLFMFGMCLITATSFDALTYLYTAPAYILCLMFCVISVFWGGETLLGFRKRG